MTKEQLEQAQQRTKELLAYNTKTGYLRDFIELIKKNKGVLLQTPHGSIMWGDYEETFQLVGEELVELLEKKLREREDYFEKLTASDLVNC